MGLTEARSGYSGIGSISFAGIEVPALLAARTAVCQGGALLPPTFIAGAARWPHCLCLKSSIYSVWLGKLCRAAGFWICISDGIVMGGT